MVGEEFKFIIMNAKYAELLRQKNEGADWVKFRVCMSFFGLGKWVTMVRMRYLCLLGPLRFYMTINHPILQRTYYGRRYNYIRDKLDLFLRTVDNAEMASKSGVPDLERESAKIAHKVYYAIRALFPLRSLHRGSQERKLMYYQNQFMTDSTELYKGLTDCECFEH